MKLYHTLIELETPIEMLNHFKSLGDLHIDVFAVSIVLCRAAYKTAWYREPMNKKKFAEELCRWALP
jgi:uncharacterized membrane protein